MDDGTEIEGNTRVTLVSGSANKSHAFKEKEE